MLMNSVIYKWNMHARAFTISAIPAYKSYSYANCMSETLWNLLYSLLRFVKYSLVKYYSASKCSVTSFPKASQNVLRTVYMW